MIENAESLILEQLRPMRPDLSLLRDDMADVRRRLASVGLLDLRDA
jgi:hypothetical protein